MGRECTLRAASESDAEDTARAQGRAARAAERATVVSTDIVDSGRVRESGECEDEQRRRGRYIRACLRVRVPTSSLTVTARAPLIGRRPPPSDPVSASSCLLSTTASNARNGADKETDTGELARYVALVAAVAAVGASNSELAAHCTRRARRIPCADDDSSSAISVMCSIIRIRQPSVVLLSPSLFRRIPTTPCMHSSTRLWSTRDFHASMLVSTATYLRTYLRTRPPDYYNASASASGHHLNHFESTPA